MKKIFIILIFIITASNAYAQITYVNHAATGANNGTSWANAYNDLRIAINNTSSGEIWVAQGTYKPTSGTDRTISFTLKNNVAIYGGFIGNETARSQRDYENNETIMSGDIGVASDTSDNSYHVIYVNGISTPIDSTAILDGITVSDGNAVDYSGGSGLLVGFLCSPIIQNCKFIENYSEEGGAVACVTWSRPIFINVEFKNNYSRINGGAVLIGYSIPIFKNCNFNNNHSDFSGGAISLSFSSGNDSTIIENCTFHSNTSSEGGAIVSYGKIIINNSQFTHNKANNTPFISSNGGAISNRGNMGITNSIFSYNKSYEYGGAIYNGDTLQVFNSVFFFNSITKSSSAILNSLHSGGISNSGDATIRNSIFKLNYIFVAALFSPPVFDYNDGVGATSDVDYCIGNNLPSSPNNYDVDPLFVSNTNFRLQSTSPAINTGDNSAIPTGITTDIEGNDRIFGGTVDMGAYEFGACNYVTNNRIYVDASKVSGLNDGLTWNNAFQDLQDALAFSQTCEAVQEIWVADGTYYPTSGTDRAIAFELKNNLKIYGGFAGNETSLSQRDFQTNISILDGDIGTSADNTDNSYHVVTSTGNDNTAILDGFTIKNGNADLSSGDYNKGAGLYGDGTSAIIQNCTFTANAASLGAGVYQKNTGNSTFTNCIFHTNTTVGFSGGGGAYIRDATSSFTNCLFYENHAYFGGGIYNLNTQITVTNSTFADNTGFHGGGIYSYDTDIQRYTVANCIFWNPSTSSEINRTGFNVTYSIINGGYTGTGNLNQDPLFVDAANDDYALQASSPAIDAGSNAAIPVGITTDLAGFDRIINGTVNMGTFETSNSVLPVELLYFKGEAIPDGNFLWWETSSESNNAGFEVQRSGDFQLWETLDFIKGAGTSLLPSSYNFLDKQPLLGVNYYRLKQIDNDGIYEYSDAIVIKRNNIPATEIHLFPNPVASTANIIIPAYEGEVEIKIADISGKVVQSQVLTNPQAQTLQMDFDQLQNGMYLLSIINGTQVATKQIIVQH